jgi:hypothetical protein
MQPPNENWRCQIMLCTSRTISYWLLVAGILSGCSQPVIGGFDYAPQYDFSEFFMVADGKPFRAILSGNPFAGVSDEDEKRLLLPVMQANRPRPRLTFTYETPADEPHPNYRVAIVFNAASDLTAARVCAGEIRHKAVPPGGRFDVFGVYCRNDLALSQAVTSMAASGPEDPRLGQMFRQLFLVLFPEYPLFWQTRGPFFMR